MWHIFLTALSINVFKLNLVWRKFTISSEYCSKLCTFHFYLINHLCDKFLQEISEKLQYCNLLQEILQTLNHCRICNRVAKFCVFNTLEPWKITFPTPSLYYLMTGLLGLLSRVISISTFFCFLPSCYKDFLLIRFVRVTHKVKIYRYRTLSSSEGGIQNFVITICFLPYLSSNNRSFRLTHALKL